MNDSPLTPFSARIKGTHQKIDREFPDTARTGLFYLLIDLVERRYVQDWGGVARELQRIARSAPVDYDSSKVPDIQKARTSASAVLHEMPWDRVYDFCERLHSRLAQNVTEPTGYGNDYEEVVSRTEVQAYIETELQRLFAEEGLAFEYSDGVVRRGGRKHTVDLATRAQVVLGDPALLPARKHYDKALHFFRNRATPDYENCVKEAVCAVEAAGKLLFPTAKASTLGDFTKWLQKTKEVSVPQSLIQVVNGIYGFRNGGEGVGHGASEGGVATLEVAEFVLAVSASQIIYFVDLANGREIEAPF